MNSQSRSCVSALFAIATIFIFSQPAHAHSVGTSYLIIESAKNEALLQARVDLSLRDLEFAIGLDSNHDARITWAEVLNSGSALENYVTQRLRITRGNQLCVPSASTLAIEQRSDGPYAALTSSLTCSAAGLIAVQSNLLFDIDDSHRSLLRIDATSTHALTVLTSSARSWIEPKNHAGGWSALLRFIEQGVWHIWTGFDHLAFLMLLLLPLARRQAVNKAALVGQILRVVTAFTLAHSITLACAAFKYIHLPSRWVEAAIAASIVITGVINLWPRAAQLGVGMAFGFGLIHGLGFASALAEISEGATNRLAPLIGFNLGVEIGQLAVVAGVFPLLYLLANAGHSSPVIQRRTVAAGSIGVSLLGMMWLIQRTLLS